MILVTETLLHALSLHYICEISIVMFSSNFAYPHTLQVVLVLQIC